MIVTDTNITVYLALQSEYSRAAHELYCEDSHWIAPVLWQSEVRHVFARYVRRSLLELHHACFQISRLERIFYDNLYRLPSNTVLALAADSGCSAYDCEFVALARRTNSALVTMDRKLVKAFPDTARLLTG